MSTSLQNSFIEFCNKNKFEINKKQTEILNSLEKFIFPRNKLLNFFLKKKKVFLLKSLIIYLNPSLRVISKPWDIG